MKKRDAVVGNNTAHKLDEEIPAELVAVIVAAASAFVGATVRILSAELVSSPREKVSKWSRQGRSFVHGSHNLRSKR